MTHQLSGACAERRAKVLVIDQDPQASISRGYFGKPTVQRLKPHDTAAAIYDPAITDYSNLIRKTPIENISIVPSSFSMAEYDKPVPFDDPSGIQFELKKFVDSVAAHYDVVLIDTPPNAMNFPAWATLVASDFLMTPVIPELNYVEAIPDIIERINAVTEQANTQLVNLGIFITGIDNRTSIHRMYHELVRKRYGGQVFDTVMPLRVQFKESAGQEPVVFYEPKSEAAELTRKLLDEAVDRMHRFSASVNSCDDLLAAGVPEPSDRDENNAQDKRRAETQ